MNSSTLLTLLHSSKPAQAKGEECHPAESQPQAGPDLELTCSWMYFGVCVWAPLGKKLNVWRCQLLLEKGDSTKYMFT